MVERLEQQLENKSCFSCANYRSEIPAAKLAGLETARHRVICVHYSGIQWSLVFNAIKGTTAHMLQRMNKVIPLKAGASLEMQIKWRPMSHTPHQNMSFHDGPSRGT